MEPMEYGSVSRVIRTIFVVFISVVLSMGMLPAQSFAGEATAKTQGVSSSTTSSAATSVDTQSVSGGSEVTGSSVDNEGTNQNVTAHQTQANDTDETSSNGISSTSSPSAPPSTVQTGGDSTDAAAIESPIETKSASSSASSSSTTASSSSSKIEEKEQEEVRLETVACHASLYQEGAFPEDDEDTLSVQSSSFDQGKLQTRISDILSGAKVNTLESDPNNSRVKKVVISNGEGKAPNNPVVYCSDMDISYSDENEVAITACYDNAINSHPNLFYVGGSFSSTWSLKYDSRIGAWVKDKLIQIKATYPAGYSAIEGMQSSYNAALSKMLSWVPANASNANKAKAVHDYLVRNCKYNTAAANSGSSGYGDLSPWNAYGALVKAAPVCQGYSLAFMAGMQKLGIDCTFVIQKSNNGGPGHSWNRVKIDGAWFNVDVTFDDTTPDRGFSATPYTDYFMKSDSYWTSHKVGSWHASWSPRGVAGTSTKYDNASWPTYNSASGKPASTTTSATQTTNSNATGNTGVNSSANASSVTSQKIYRLYNDALGEHLYTTDVSEVKTLTSRYGWVDEGTAWVAPTKNNTAAKPVPVYRLYNAGLSTHLYTTDINEVNTLCSKWGWVKDFNGSPLFYSGGSVSINRLYNGGLSEHHYTADKAEIKNITQRKYGWVDEGAKLKCLSLK